LFAVVFLAAANELNLPIVTGGMTAVCVVMIAMGLWQMTQEWPYPSGPFIEHNAYAGLTGGLVVVGAGWLERVGRRLKHLLSFGLVALASFVLPLPAWMAIAAGLLVMLAFRQTRAAGVAGLVAVAAGIAVSAVFLHEHFMRQLTDLAVYDPNGNDISQRYIEWWAALNMISDNPIFGVGIGNYQAFIGKYYGFLPKLDNLQWNAQNGWLVAGSTMGLAGLCMMAWLFFGAFRTASRRLREGGNPAAAFLMGAIVAWAVSNIFTVVSIRETLPVVMIALALLWGNAAGIREPADGEELRERS
jgi:O-antigen ligase